VPAVVRFHRSAQRELIRAAELYEDHADGLGDQFLDEVSAALEMLCEHPEAGEVIVPRIRRPIRRWVL
jgi:plasmid stabilization system protein ParE